MSCNEKLCIYISPGRIPNVRYKMMMKAAFGKKFPVVETFSDSVTCIATEFESIEQVLRSLKLTSLPCGVIVVSCKWITDSLRAGKLLELNDEYLMRSNNPCNIEEVPKVEKVYACQRITRLNHHNQIFTDALELLQRHAELRNEKHDYLRALAFRRGACVLKSLAYKITNLQQIEHFKDIGSHCHRVIEEILNNDVCAEVQLIRNDSYFKKMEIFSGVFGVGAVTANKWIELGLNTIKDATEHLLRVGSDDTRKICGLGFYDDLSTPVSRESALMLQSIIQDEVNELLPGALIELTGGFRRGKQNGHDVDLLISHPDEGKEKGILTRLISKLYRNGMILMGNHERSSFRAEKLYTDDKLSIRGQLDHFEKWIGIIKYRPSLPPTKRRKLQNSEISTDHGGSLYDCLEDKNICDITLPKMLELAAGDRDWKAMRMDLVITPFSQFYYALVGWTGSKQFNRSLRLYSQKELNMKLTSHGLYDYTQRKSVSATSEQEVFDNLKLQYREPHERNC